MSLTNETSVKLLIWSILGFFLFGLVVTWLAQHAVTAHAQKPKPSLDSHHDPFIGPWIEQHCVAVIPKDVNYPQKLRLSCQEDTHAKP
jgi:hypothetical protein